MKSFGIGQILAASALITAATASAQQTSTAAAAAQTRTSAIVASFNKYKHVVKERHGVRREKYKDVRSEPVIKANPQDYSGTYEVPDMGFGLRLRVDRNGNAEGDGYEPVGPDASVRRRFTLRNGRIEGALLTATQVYDGGTQDRFEGVFINRTSFDSPTDKGTTEFGLGVIARQIGVGGLAINKFFYTKR
jgi:opacity protein-like surface antigen